jgi:hypothetical protein
METKSYRYRIADTVQYNTVSRSAAGLGRTPETRLALPGCLPGLPLLACCASSEFKVRALAARTGGRRPVFSTDSSFFHSMNV